MAKAIQFDFHAVMARRSKEQLLAVVREGHDYVPDAVQAAYSELKRRGVNAFDIAAAEDLALENQSLQIQLSKVSMTSKEALLWLLFPIWALSPWGVKRFETYANAGFRRKSIQILEFAFIGFSLYTLLAIVVMQFVR
jgi:hypothetical protein